MREHMGIILRACGPAGGFVNSSHVRSRHGRRRGGRPFLAMLELAREHLVESPRPKPLTRFT